MTYKIKKMTMQNGERYCLLVDKNSDMPLSYPNLFVTCFLRNNGASVSTIEIALSNIIILLRFLKVRKIDLEKRIENNAFLDLSEIEALMRYLRKNFSSLRNGAEIIPFNRNVAKGTYNYRIHTIKSYMKWICGLLLKAKGIIERQAVDDFIKSIEAYKPN
ncbi:hypothetical protein [Erwinia mallotivora]|uniref:hypothetical protein n=1 Tax=Erwinia mallotivora TaxID=69222 RepID=UPI0021C14400|nr:hypothetical protein [Erwinia mallotivora]